MNPTTTPENIANSLKMYSTWVAMAICGLYGWWMQLPMEQQQQILAQWPALKYYAPIFSFAVWYAARVMSQNKPDTSLLGATNEPVTGPQIGVAGLTSPPAAPVVPETPPTMTLQLTASEIAAILNAAEALKKQAPQ
ncbi:MAG: hypothetical protein AB7F22_05340 [Reyranella sp.]|uniref:hypothetical protein n=1 Tax=Reyranella sp. TaxID=1929291 RepID=UPI003D0A5F83